MGICCPAKPLDTDQHKRVCYMRKRERALALSIGLLSATNGIADAEKVPVDKEIDLSAGLFSESSLIKTGTEEATDTSDLGANIALNASAGTKLSRDLSADASIGLSDTRYSKQSEFNVMTRLLNLSATYQVPETWAGDLNLGLSVYSANARLDGKNYLDIRQVAPSISRFLTRQHYLHAEYGLGSRSFKQDAERDADTREFNVRLYWLLQGSDHYLNAHYARRKENAQSELYDFSANKLSLNWRYRTELKRYKWEFNANVTREDQHYEEARDEHSDSLLAGATVFYTEHSYLNASYDYLNNSSNQEAFDYTQHRLELRAGRIW